METIIFLISVFLAGVLSFFSPCIFPLLPVYVGILLDSDDERTITILGRKVYWHGLIKTLSFIAGLSTIFLILGYGAGFLGAVLYADWFRYVLGTIVIILGIHQMDIITIKKLQMQKSITFNPNKKRNDIYGAFLLGITFSFGWTPCVGPVLSSVLAIAASGGSGAVQGGFLMLAYTLGMALPFLLMALASTSMLKHFNRLKPYLSTMKKIGGALIIVMGILLMTGQLGALAAFFESSL
ncbi:thiol-disulfide oxidoreductase-associated membrane protein CcdA2 [Streptococcus pacificus]|uniref:Thiol-disulfide oxidoreductase-associated membrane protein CcdA2 n=1 Tax=Streptococcus pacificus TaxID=2740577 RepID=A0ABS0ZJH5_9STRE|nr:thiol-disulfide oxidoreductase-associated membrane protein CcdA2 [Streptococcus pacificus]MBJ8326132.1 thiol-disulfide oxidoreductase-associated membrane protein CcdA2 [Streptococcus pacificus]